ncbi:MAG: hypothetical protein SH847_09660 [Roseiflexaceae bacterium]|nr:hypothetical protein [Roseiflexaceae bacterium]
MQQTATTGTLIAQRHWIALIPRFAIAVLVMVATIILLPLPSFLVAAAFLSVFILIWQYWSWQLFRIQITSAALHVRTLSWRGRETITIPLSHVHQLRISYAPFSEHMIQIHADHRHGSITFRLLVIVTPQRSP